MKTIATEIRKHFTSITMGCGPSSPAVSESTVPDSKKRRQSVVLPPPDIPINLGSNVKFQPPPNSKIVVIIGGPGSGKGRLVANLRSMFGMKLVSVESIILKYLPKKVAHLMALNSVDEIADLVRKEPSHVSLEWVLRLLQHYIESDPDQIFIIDLIPSLRWLLRDEHLIKDCSTELESFESRCPISFAIHLSLGLESLDKTLDYSHHNAPAPPGATVGDEADNGRAKRRFQMHENACRPFLDYFSSSDRLVSIDVSSGAEEPIWDKVHEFFTGLHLQAWRPVNSILVFAMEGLQVGNLDLTATEMQVIVLKDIMTDPNGSVESILESLSEHIDTLAATSHYFVIDPSGTSIVNQNMGLFHKRSPVFSDIREKTEGCLNKFSQRLNNMVGGDKPYFKAVCSSEDETLIFPCGTPDTFCQQMALCMALKHPSKK